MSATTWLIIAIIGFSLAGIALVIAIFMFIKMNIPSIIGDLTGKTVAREIKAMREFNKANGDRRFRSSNVNLKRGTLTEKVEISQDAKNAMAEAHSSMRLDKNDSIVPTPVKKTRKSSGTVGLNDFAAANAVNPINEGSEPTEMLNDNATEVLSDNATEVLSDNATEVLSDNATEVLSDNATEILSDNATEVLDENTSVLSEGTTVLSYTEKLEEIEDKPVAFKVIKDKVLTHTDEVIG